MFCVFAYESSSSRSRKAIVRYRDLRALSMQKLILKQANKNRLGAIDRSSNDFDVLDADRCTRLTA